MGYFGHGPRGAMPPRPVPPPEPQRLLVDPPPAWLALVHVSTVPYTLRPDDDQHADAPLALPPALPPPPSSAVEAEPKPPPDGTGTNAPSAPSAAATTSATGLASVASAVAAVAAGGGLPHALERIRAMDLRAGTSANNARRHLFLADHTERVTCLDLHTHVATRVSAYVEGVFDPLTGVGAEAHFLRVGGVCVDPLEGSLVVSEPSAHRVRTIRSDLSHVLRTVQDALPAVWVQLPRELWRMIGQYAVLYAANVLVGGAQGTSDGDGDAASLHAPSLVLCSGEASRVWCIDHDRCSLRCIDRVRSPVSGTDEVVRTHTALRPPHNYRYDTAADNKQRGPEIAPPPTPPVTTSLLSSVAVVSASPPLWLPPLSSLRAPLRVTFDTLTALCFDALADPPQSALFLGQATMRALVRYDVVSHTLRSVPLTQLDGYKVVLQCTGMVCTPSGDVLVSDALTHSLVHLPRQPDLARTLSPTAGSFRAEPLPGLTAHTQQHAFGIAPSAHTMSTPSEEHPAGGVRVRCIAGGHGRTRHDPRSRYTKVTPLTMTADEEQTSYRDLLAAASAAIAGGRGVGSPPVLLRDGQSLDARFHAIGPLALDAAQQQVFVADHGADSGRGAVLRRVTLPPFMFVGPTATSATAVVAVVQTAAGDPRLVPAQPVVTQPNPTVVAALTQARPVVRLNIPRRMTPPAAATAAVTATAAITAVAASTADIAAAVKAAGKD